MTFFEVFRGAAHPAAGVGVAAPVSASTRLEAREAAPLPCGRTDRQTGWACTMPPHRSPIHRDQSSEAFEYTWSEK